MNREITLRYTPEIIRFSARQFWRRSIGLSGFVTFGLMLGLAVYLLIDGERSWQSGVVWTVVLLSLLVGVVSYRIYLSRSMEKFKRLKDATAKFRFTDKGIWVESEIGSSEVAWNFIEKIWAFPNVWLLFYPKQGYTTLPVTEIDEELRQFIISKVTESGGKVVLY